LAAVIAHEIAHIQLAHGFEAIKRSRVNQAFAQAAFDVGTAASNIDLTRVAETFGLSVDVVVDVMLNGYSREQEFEADSVAISLLALAGYEPSALIDVLRLLERNQPNRRGGFNNTHPTPAQRITNAQRTVGNYEVEDTRSYRVARHRAVM
jgi:predicted Zn-dependent protease